MQTSLAKESTRSWTSFDASAGSLTMTRTHIIAYVVLMPILLCSVRLANCGRPYTPAPLILHANLLACCRVLFKLHRFAFGWTFVFQKDRNWLGDKTKCMQEVRFCTSSRMVRCNASFATPFNPALLTDMVVFVYIHIVKEGDSFKLIFSFWFHYFRSGYSWAQLHNHSWRI